MKCPNCDATLVMSDRNGVEIDYCPECRGVWLDRGELDKIIERSTEFAKPGHQKQGYKDERHYDKDDPRNQPYKKKNDSFLSDLFDF